VAGARKKMLDDMVPGLEGEVRQSLDVEGIANAEGSRWLAGLLRPALEAEGGALSHPTDWYNDDERLAAAMQQMLDAKRQVGPGGLRRARALSRLAASKVEALGFDPEAFSEEVASALRQVEDSDRRVRIAAVATLGKLEQAVLAQHAAAVVAKLEHSDGGVREAAVETLGKLEPAAQEDVLHGVTSLSSDMAELVVAQLCDSRWQRSGGGQPEGTHSVTADLSWLFGNIQRTGILITTIGWWVSAASFTDGKLESLEWRDTAGADAKLLVWARLQ
jgi:hypothetical protein